MNNKDSLIKNVLDFLENNEKVVLITGTNQYEKHKTVIAILNKYLPINLKFYLEQIYG